MDKYFNTLQIKCKKLERKRDPTLINYETKDYEEKMKELLYRNSEHNKTSHMIRDIWILRRDMLKKLKEGETQEENKPPQSDQSTERNPSQSGPSLSGLPQSRTINPPQSGPPLSGLPQSRTSNPPQSGPPQCGLPQSRVSYTS